MAFGVGLSVEARAMEILWEALCQSHSPDQKLSPAISLSSARPQRHPSSSEEVGLYPPEVIQSSPGEPGHISQCGRETFPGLCWGMGGG